MRQNERFVNTVLALPVDRPPFFPIWGPWPQTVNNWKAQGMQANDAWLTAPGFDHMFEWVAMVDSDDFVEELAPLFVEAGINLFYPFEMQAGNDLLRIRRPHPTLGMTDGMNKLVLAQGHAEIDAEMDAVREVFTLGCCIPAPDHMI